MTASRAGATPGFRRRLFGRKGSAHPRLRFGLSWPFVRPGLGDGLGRDVRLVMPFRRSRPAIAIFGVLFAGFCVPLLSIGGQLDGFGDGDLFSLTFSLFHLFWLLGWSVAVIVLGLVFAVLLAGREVVHAQAGRLTVHFGLPGIGVAAEFDAAQMRNLRAAAPDEQAGTGWRGPHLAFDYGGLPVGFGSSVTPEDAGALIARLRRALVVPVPDGEAPAAAPDAARASDDEPPPAEPRSAVAPAASAPPVTLRSPSTLALVASNLVPLAGVVLLDWSIGEVMILYWAESAIIGVFNLMKMIVVGRWATLFFGPFFVGHYGAFMAGHLLFISGFFLSGLEGGELLATAEVLDAFVALWPALLALGVSHAISYRVNFIGRAEYAGRTINVQMGEPYKRIMVMHVTIIFGGFLVMALGSALPALVLLVGLKLAADTRAHLREHGGPENPAGR